MHDHTIGVTSLIATGLLAALGGVNDQAFAETPCDSSAEAYFDLSPFQRIEVSLSMHLEGNGGIQDLSFVSGVSLSAVVAAINTLTGAVGMHAEQSRENPQRIRMLSIATGVDAFVSVQQIGGDQPRVFELSLGGTGQWSLIAHGENGLDGDSNCDGHVGVSDLLNVIGNWGACPALPQACMGDLDLNSVVNVADLLAVISNWGPAH